MTDTNYVAVPREPTPEMIAAGRKVRQDGFSEIAIFDAMIAAAPPAASVRARGLVWTVDTEDGFESHTAEVNAPNINYFEVGPSQKGFYAKAEHSQDRDATWYGTQFPSIEAAKAACYEAWNAYVRSLLAPTVDERAASSVETYDAAEEMCQNCVTPWKCNGPHEFPQAASSEAAVAFDAERFERAPCYLCGYNGRGYYQPETHPCAAKYHAHPAPTTADAGVTEAMVETFEAKFLECARTRPDSTFRDDIRAALVAALGAREGE